MNFIGFNIQSFRPRCYFCNKNEFYDLYEFETHFGKNCLLDIDDEKTRVKLTAATVKSQLSEYMVDIIEKLDTIQNGL